MFPNIDKKALHLSHVDPASLLSSCSNHAIHLEGKEWPSVEHYVQAMKFASLEWQEQIRAAEHPKLAQKMGKNFWKKKKPNWKAEREVYMTRGMYTKCKAWPEVGAALVATGEQSLLDVTKYDYFWGCGRDGRGLNRYGRVLEGVRKKLRSELASAADTTNAQKPPTS